LVILVNLPTILYNKINDLQDQNNG
jgi:hypothetical protein